MAVYRDLTYFFIFIVVFVNGDFFSDLDKLDIDSKLREIDKAINSIDKEDSIADNLRGKTKQRATDEEDPTLGSAVEMLADIFGSECKYQCKNGNNPVAKAEHVPTSNGCGSSGIKIDTEDIPGIEDCCNSHDYCYDTCNTDRTTCDKEFKECLHDACKKIQSSNKKKISHKDCKATADILYSGTAALGCDAFLKAQENSCSCKKTPKSDKSKKSEAHNVPKKEQQKRKPLGQRNDEL